MNSLKRSIPLLFGTAVLLMLMASCSTKKNTKMTRAWHSFTAHYNTYFNGEQAFIEGEKAKLSGHTDNYTELLPVFLVSSEKSRTTGKSQFETAITKCQKAIAVHSIKRRPAVSPGKSRNAKTKEYLKRKEFNPFLKNAWLLMGQAQFEKGEFLEAAATFSYITRLYAAEPAVAAEARQWLARCYTQVDWYYDAEDALQRMSRDSVSRRVLREADATQADLLIRQERFAEALPYLERAAKNAKGAHRKARLYYLMGQIHQQMGHATEAYKALGKCIKKSPPFELSFNARILQTEVAAANKANSKKMIGKLRRMARDESNKDYLDQVYYAMGNIYLATNDTARAIGAYETGREKSQRNGVEKGVLLLRLGAIYWDKRLFEKAQQCYTDALGLIDKEHDNYEEITRRSKVLDKLVPFTSAIALQDSLQALSRMSEAERNAAIDRVIEALKKKEEEERQAKLDSAAQARAEENGQTGSNQTNNNPTTQKPRPGQNSAWYFYNPTVVMQGKQAFMQLWGKRKNEDNWRRSNRTVVAMNEAEGFDYEADDSLRAVADSLAAVEEQQQTEEAVPDSAANDPHQREYYLKQIPFTDEARAASDDIIKDGLYNAGIIEKDDLEDFPLAAETLERLVTQYTQFDRMADAYYQLFLLYSRWGRTDKAHEMKLKMAQLFPDNDLTRLINAPNFEHNARYGKEIEDSLYTATYQAYRKRDHATVEANFARSTNEFAQGLNRPKFIFVHALSRLSTADSKELIAELRELISKFPESDVSPMAGMIVKGLESGREIGTGTFDLGSLWDRRTAAADSLADDAAKKSQFSPERNAPFLFVLVFPNDSVDTNRLLYEMAHFNFTSFVVRGFDMTVTKGEGLSQFRIAGFNSYDEVHAYAQRCFKSAELLPFLKKGRVLLISKENLDLLGVRFSVNDYQKFFDATFAPIELKPNQPIEQMAPVEQHYEDEYTPEELERINGSNSNSETENSSDDEESEWY